MIARPTRVSTLSRLAAVAAAFGLSIGARGADPHPEWTLYAPLGSGQTFLIDLDGNVERTWSSIHGPGMAVELTDGGAIVRAANDPTVQPFGGAGVGGRIERIAWDGTLEWSYVASGADYVQHHDIEVLPNGNVLVIVWQRFTDDDAIAMGRDPASVAPQVWSDSILEIEPDGATGGTIVWEWHAWDHLVQDFDAGLPNFGAPADHPGRIDINYGSTRADWLHCNGIDYNAALDQIVVSIPTFDEVWIISHDPGDDGDILYRWGNPEAYGRGGPGDRRLFGQHDPQWIPAGTPGAGHLTIFNNGTDRGYSSVEEVDTAVNPDGTYDLLAGQPYAPADPTWTCDDLDGAPYFMPFMSGAQRVPNGNHLVTLALTGQLVEIDENCNTVWSHGAGAQVFKATRLGARDPRLEGLLWLAGDANGDFVVNLADLLIVLSEWGASGPAGDVDGSGLVDLGDLLLVLSEWS